MNADPGTAARRSISPASSGIVKSICGRFRDPEPLGDVQPPMPSWREQSSRAEPVEDDGPGEANGKIPYGRGRI